MVSERPLQLGHAPSSTPPRALHVSRIEIRLLRDTKRLLEYLSEKDGCSQPCVLRVCDKMNSLSLQFPEYVGAAGDLYKIDQISHRFCVRTN